MVEAATLCALKQGSAQRKRGRKAFFREQEAACFSSHHPVPRAMTKGWRQLALVSLSPRSARCLPVAII